jgi:hypothetical protein
VDGDDFGATAVAGFAVCEAGFLDLRVRLEANGGSTCSALAGSALRANGPVKSLRLERSSESADGLGSVADEFESVVGTSTEGSASAVASLDLSSGALELPTVLASPELSGSTEDRLLWTGDVSVEVTLGAESDGGPLAGRVREVCERKRTCFPNGPRPREAKTSTLAFVAASPMIKPITANKNTSAATCNPDRSKIYKCAAESLAPSADDLSSSV